MSFGLLSIGRKDHGLATIGYFIFVYGMNVAL